MSCNRCRSCSGEISQSEGVEEPYPVASRSSQQYRDPYRNDSNGFQAMIVPVTALTTFYGSNPGLVSFQLRRKSKAVTLQWEPFTGQVGGNGIDHISVNQTIYGLPAHPLEIPIRITYKGAPRLGYVRIDPASKEQIKFYFDISGTGGETQMGDAFIIPGSSIGWVL